MMKCINVNCKLEAIKGSNYCNDHQPEIDQEKDKRERENLSIAKRKKTTLRPIKKRR
jgi:hypothetical protein